MSVVSRDTEKAAFGALRSDYSHFAYGTYPCSQWTTYPVNRFLLVTHAGKSSVASTHRCLALREGHGYFLPAGHAVRVELDAWTTFYSIQASLDFFFAGDVLTKLPDISEVPAPSEWFARAKTVFHESNPFPFLLGLKALVYDVFARVASGLPEEAWEVADKWRRFKAIREQMTDGVTARVTVAGLAKTLGMSREGFSRTFTRSFNLPPKRMLEQNLMRKAFVLLSRPDARIKEVAFALGFTNEFYFSRFFRRHAGVPPSAVGSFAGATTRPAPAGQQ